MSPDDLRARARSFDGPGITRAALVAAARHHQNPLDLRDLRDQLVARLTELGPSSTSVLAMEERRRRATVLEALHGDPRFHRTGTRRGARWHLRPDGWTLAEYATPRGLSLEEAQLFIEGEEGLIEKGIVRATGPGFYECTARGTALACEWNSCGGEEHAA